MGIFDEINKGINKISPYNPGTGEISTPGDKGQQNWDAAFPSDHDDQGALNNLTNETIGNNNQANRAAATAEDLKQQQLGIASDIEGEGFKGDLFNQFRNRRLKDLATDQSVTEKRMAHRGLLGPGAEGVKQKNLSNASGDIAEGKGKIRSFADEQAAQIRASVLNQGLKERQTKQYMYDSIYNSALQDYQMKRASQDEFMKGAGMVIGAGIA